MYVCFIHRPVSCVRVYTHAQSHRAHLHQHPFIARSCPPLDLTTLKCRCTLTELTDEMKTDAAPPPIAAVREPSGEDDDGMEAIDLLSSPSKSTEAPAAAPVSAASSGAMNETSCCFSCSWTKVKSACCSSFQLVYSGQLLPAFFSRVGYIVASYPLRTVCVCVLVTLLCCLGFLNFSTETSDNKLFTPQESRAYDDKKWVDSNFRSASISQDYYAIDSVDYAAANAPEEPEKKERNVLTRDALLALFEFGAEVLNVGKTNASVPTYDEVCVVLPSTGSCYIESILELWSYEPSAVLQDDDVLKTINTRIEEEVQETGDSRTRRLLGGVVFDEDIIGTDAGDGVPAVVSAGATKMRTLVSFSALSELFDDDKKLSNSSLSARDGLVAWELAVVDSGEEFTARDDKPIDVYVDSFFALDAEANATLSADIWKLAVR